MMFPQHALRQCLNVVGTNLSTRTTRSSSSSNIINKSSSLSLLSKNKASFSSFMVGRNCNISSSSDLTLSFHNRQHNNHHRNNDSSSNNAIMYQSPYRHHQHRRQQQQQHQMIVRYYYSPMTKEEEENEKQRVAKLSDFKKEQELRKLNREILKLQMLRGINTGELYTIRGKYKMLLNEYGIPMMIWYGVMWLTSGSCIYILATIGGMDAMYVLSQIDYYTNFNMASKVDPTLGKLGIVIILNEMLEPLRLPFVVLTVKPVMDRFFPPKV